MTAEFPGAVKQFTTKRNLPDGDLVDASHINDLQNEVMAIETELLKTNDSSMVITHNALSGREQIGCHPQYMLISSLPNFYFQKMDMDKSGMIQGWASTTVRTGDYVNLNGVIFFNFEIGGTSNSNVAKIKLPAKARVLNSTTKWHGTGWGTDNGVAQSTPVMWKIDPDDEYVTIYKNGANAVWTSSGRKIVKIQGFYEPERVTPFP